MIIGVGKLGSQVAFVTMLKNRPEKIVLSDRKDLNGDILDLQHAAIGLGLKTIITDKREPVDFIIVTTGMANTPVFGDEKALAPFNEQILKKIDITECTKPGTVLIMMTNPVYEMTNLAKKLWSELKVVNPEDELLKIRGGKDCGWEIIKTKGYTNFGAAVSAALLIEKLVISSSNKEHEANQVLP